jgi:hypothetical protein
MVQQNIVSYILSQLKQGRSLEETNRFLLEAGYDRSEVESSVQYVINLQTNPKIAEEQRIQQLAKYAQEQLSAGYNQQAIANFLISRGYPYYEVNSALQQATAPPKEVKTEHKLVVFALIAMFVMTTAVTLMYFRAYTLIGIGMPEKLLDVEAEKLTTIVQQGGELAFQVKLINFGYEKRFDVLLEYKVVDRDTQGIVLEKSETVALSTTLENIVKFDIPETMKPGKYVLRVDAKYKDFTATSGFIFDLLPKELAQEQIEAIRKQVPNITENISIIPELAPAPEKAPEAVPTPIPTTTEKKFYEGKTRQQAFEMVKAVSVREPQRAVEMCNEFVLSANRNACIITLAEFKKSPLICESIEDPGHRDNCYLQIAMNTKTKEACDGIQDANVKQMCMMLAIVKQSQTPEGQLNSDMMRDNIKMFNVTVTPYNR